MLPLRILLPCLCLLSAHIAPACTSIHRRSSSTVVAVLMLSHRLMQAALQQISKVERMVQLEQFSGARLQLREGSASTLRKDLRDAQEFSPQITDTVRRRKRMRHEFRCVRWNALARRMTVCCCSGSLARHLSPACGQHPFDM